MPLTQDECDFLDAYVYEMTAGVPFGGPATRGLAAKDVYYEDLSWILTAYQREYSAAGVPPIGKLNPTPPPSPWESLDEVKRRNEALRQEWEPQILEYQAALRRKMAPT